jgi:hypothetical protein
MWHTFEHGLVCDVSVRDASCTAVAREESKPIARSSDQTQPRSRGYCRSGFAGLVNFHHMFFLKVSGVSVPHQERAHDFI